MPELELRAIPLEQTRALRREVLRPYLTVEQLAEHEPDDAAAYGAFDGDELIAVGLVGPEGEPGDWRVRGMATMPRRGAGEPEPGSCKRSCNTRAPRRHAPLV